MCSVCVYTAAAGVTGFRAWLQSRGWLWLTRRRLRWLTIAAVVAGLGLATVSLS
jgi:hypothetical protein